ncbi:hypothetical protein Taro_038725, partial [Colocasia esculenta]|nr:hypothetical protein [Colocasia esculenta]
QEEGPQGADHPALRVRGQAVRAPCSEGEGAPEPAQVAAGLRGVADQHEGRAAHGLRPVLHTATCHGRQGCSPEHGFRCGIEGRFAYGDAKEESFR